LELGSSLYLADNAFQVVRFGAGGDKGVIGGLGPFLDDLHPSPDGNCCFVEFGDESFAAHLL